MERDEVVEYVERNDSDDEFDEVIDFYLFTAMMIRCSTCLCICILFIFGLNLEEKWM